MSHRVLPESLGEGETTSGASARKFCYLLILQNEQQWPDSKMHGYSVSLPLGSSVNLSSLYQLKCVKTCVNSLSITTLQVLPTALIKEENCGVQWFYA